MIKKITAYSLILLANIVLLAHAVLPHHHHEQQICIEQKHCVGDEVAHIHDSHEKDHKHDGNSNTTSCVLKQAVVIAVSQNKILKNCDDCTDNHNHDFYTLSTFGNVDFQPITEIIIYTPDFPSFYTTNVTPTLGLRAPPIV